MKNQLFGTLLLSLMTAFAGHSPAEVPWDRTELEYFSHYAPGGFSVAVKGSFNDWSATNAIPMRLVPGGPPGLYEGWARIERPFEYKVAVNGVLTLENANSDPDIQVLVTPARGEVDYREGEIYQSYLRKMIQWEEETGISSAQTLYARLDPTAPPPEAENFRAANDLIATGSTRDLEAAKKYLESAEVRTDFVWYARDRESLTKFPPEIPLDPIPYPFAISLGMQDSLAEATLAAIEGRFGDSLTWLEASAHLANAMQTIGQNAKTGLMAQGMRLALYRAARRILENYGSEMPPEELAAFTKFLEMSAAQRASLSEIALKDLRISYETASDDLERLKAGEPTVLGLRAMPLLNFNRPALERAYAELETNRLEFGDFSVQEKFMRWGEFRDRIMKTKALLNSATKKLVLFTDEELNFWLLELTNDTRERLLILAAHILASSEEQRVEEILAQYRDPFTGQSFFYDADAAEPFLLKSTGPDTMFDDNAVELTGQLMDRREGDIIFGDRDR